MILVFIPITLLIVAEKKFDLITLGEIMLRLSPPHNERIMHGDTFEKHAGGAELNVASGVSLLGLRSGIISKLPQSELGIYTKNRIRNCGVSDDFIVYDNSPDARLGIYYYENGAFPRKPCVIYDRKHASINSLSIQELNPDMFTKTRMFHTSGITLALSESTRKLAIECIKRFKENDTLISFDVNYRANLWNEETARNTIYEILPYLDILFISEETCRKMFQKKGTLKEMMESFATEFPNLKIIASTKRVVHSPKSHSFGSTVYSAQDKTFYEEKPYEYIDVVDRIGSGDSYCAGVLFGILKYDNPQKAMEFGNAYSAVKNTVNGDLPLSDFAEISRIIKSHQNTTGEESEMNR